MIDRDSALRLASELVGPGPPSLGPAAFRETRSTVIGAGPIGLLAAISLRAFGGAVTVVHDLPVHAGLAYLYAAGLVEPVGLDGEDVTRWFSFQLETLTRLATVPGNPFGVHGTSVLLYSGYPLDQDWLSAVHSLRVGSPHRKYPYARRFPTFVIHTPTFLGALYEVALGLGIEFQEREVTVDEALLTTHGTSGPDLLFVAGGLANAWLVPDPSIDAGHGVTIRWRTRAWPKETLFWVGGNGTGAPMTYVIPRPISGGLTEVIAGGCNYQIPPDDPGTIATGVALVDEVIRGLYQHLPKGVAGRLFNLESDPETTVGARPMGPKTRIQGFYHRGASVVAIGPLAGSGVTLNFGVVGDALRTAAQMLLGDVPGLLHLPNGSTYVMTNDELNGHPDAGA